MSEAFEVGDVVHLKSGGPSMTVTSVGTAAMSGVESVWCAWFDQKGNQQSGTFPIGTVEKD